MQSYPEGKTKIQYIGDVETRWRLKGLAAEMKMGYGELIDLILKQVIDQYKKHGISSTICINLVYVLILIVEMLVVACKQGCAQFSKEVFYGSRGSSPLSPLSPL